MTLAPKISKADWTRFVRLRKEFFGYIKVCLQADSSCKSYEGTFSIGYELPNFFGEKDQVPMWTIHLDCYLVGPRRHYEWSGATFKEALAAAERDINRWVQEE